MVKVPERGDLIWLQFEPQAGKEIQKTRPALVLSPASYNGKTGLCLVVPVTGQVKGYPFEVLLPAGLIVAGAVLADQVKAMDWRARNARVADRAPPEVLEEVLGKLAALLGI
ncbi:MAG: endoribonuclease MazF [Candidatus Lambdaproteobacteria bacterium]|nr:endoribonuclease MazF [Candidatus Lambdaproteobacteria bacterium]